MAKRLTSGEQLFRAVCKNPKAQEMTKFPPAVQKGLIEALDGLTLPPTRSKRDTFKKHFARMCGAVVGENINILSKFLERAPPELIDTGSFNLLGRLFCRAGTIAKICLDSSNPSRYVAFMADLTEKNKGVPVDFVSHMPGFLKRTEIVFDEPCDLEPAYFLHRSVEITKRFWIGNILGFVSPNLGAKIRGCADGENLEIAVESEKDYVIQHELQHLFDYLLRLSPVFGSDVSTEYRGYLASLAFTDTYQLRAFKPENTIFLEKPTGPTDKLSPHAFAKQRYYKEFLAKGTITRKDWMEGKVDVEKIKESALQLLNEAYKRICGFTYERILEPFSKQRRVGTDWA